jgi:hypothetical protein
MILQLHFAPRYVFDILAVFVQACKLLVVLIVREFFLQHRSFNMFSHRLAKTLFDFSRCVAADTLCIYRRKRNLS